MGTFHFPEPTNNIAPKALETKYGFSKVFNGAGQNVFMTCQVAAFPIPKFRYQFFFNTVNFDLEPTGNVPPKIPGKKYDGGRLEYWQRNSFLALTCEVVGYPPPKYRYLY